MLVAALSPAILFDPRGRCSRKGLLVVSGLLLVVEVAVLLLWLATGASLQGPVAGIVNAALLWSAVAATAKRLHDIGRSAWWMLGGMFAIMAWCFIVTTAMVLAFGAEALAPQGSGFAVAFGATCLLALALLLWLHCQPGMPGANQYGPAPGLDGFAPPLAVAANGGDSLATPA